MNFEYFFSLPRKFSLRRTYYVSEVFMVEAAGVEPLGALHLFAYTCTSRSLSVSYDISQIGGNTNV